MKSQKIYTKTGDKGTTGTINGRHKKSDQLPVALGSVDELNSWMGFFRASVSMQDERFLGIDRELLEMQNNLLIIGSILAGARNKIKRQEIRNLEKLIDRYTDELPVVRNFIFPVGNLQVIRSVARRAEREVVLYKNEGGVVDVNILAYLNRISDALFVLGRWVAKETRLEEKIWKG